MNARSLPRWAILSSVTLVLGTAVMMGFVFRPNAPTVSHDTYLEIAAAGRSGRYFMVALDGCGIVNRENPGSGDVRCVVVETDGSLANLTYLVTGHVDLAIVQADVLTEAMASQDSPLVKVRNSADPCRGEGAPVELVEEAIFAVTREDSRYKKIDDVLVTDKDAPTISAGPEGSGTRYTVERLLATVAQHAGFEREIVYELDILPALRKSIPQAICADEIQVGFQVIDTRHKIPAVIPIKDDYCKLRLIPLQKVIDTSLLAEMNKPSRYLPRVLGQPYRAVSIALDGDDLPEAPNSIGMSAHLVTTKRWCRKSENITKILGWIAESSRREQSTRASESE